MAQIIMIALHPTKPENTGTGTKDPQRQGDCLCLQEVQEGI